jgi:4-carboxymuconolactone decarboxylase
MTQSRRFGPLEYDDMTGAQRAVADEILAGPRAGQMKRVGGPFEPLLRSPGMTALLQRVGAYVRFESSMPADLNEMAVLLTARRWTAQFEWFAHRRLAIEAGLDPDVADAIGRGETPEHLDEPAAAVHRFTMQLLDTGAVTDDAFKQLSKHFSEEQIVDLIGTVGYYCTISFILNVDRCPTPDGTVPLAPLSVPGAH